MKKEVLPGLTEALQGRYRLESVFCSFLALVLRKELQDRMAARGLRHEWADVIRALRGLREIDLSIQGKEVIIRPQTNKVAADAYATFGLALPPVVRFRT